MELLVFLTFSCSIGYQGFADYCYRFYAVKKHLEWNVYECMGCFASSFLPLLTLHIADSGAKPRLNGCPTVFVGTVYVKLAPAWKCIDCKRLSRFPRCCCSWLYVLCVLSCMFDRRRKQAIVGSIFLCCTQVVENNKPAFCFPSERVNPTLCA